MIITLTPEKAAECDKYMIEKLKIPSQALMEQAATGIADEVKKILPHCKVLILCGKGNNGGDGYAAARILLTEGYDVYCGAAEAPKTPDCIANSELLFNIGRAEMIDNCNEFFKKHSDADILIDALFGTGLHRPPSGIYADIIDCINRYKAVKICADIPSGVFGINGQGDKAVRADITVTFQHPKTGHFIFPGRENTGRLVIKKIGIDNYDADNAPLSDVFFVDKCEIMPRKTNSNKGTFGRLAIIAGKKGMTGAAVLCARAAVASGVGLTRVGTCEFSAGILQVSVPEAIVSVLGRDSVEPDMISSFISSDLSAAAIGPGIGTDEKNHIMLREFLNRCSDIPKVLDADALNIIAEHKELQSCLSGCIITPHPKEFSRLTGAPVSEILSDPISFAKSYSDKTGAVVLLKGATTVIAKSDKCAIVTSGTPGMAKGGSGDVLTGVTGGLLAQGYELFEAAYTAAWLCGKAGEKAAEEKSEYSSTPSDTIRFLYKV